MILRIKPVLTFGGGLSPQAFFIIAITFFIIFICFLRKGIRLRGIVLIMKCRYFGSIDESEYPDSIIRMP